MDRSHFYEAKWHFSAFSMIFGVFCKIFVFYRKKKNERKRKRLAWAWSSPQ
jgi:predicted histidine transporter YuiF (NhaC family)